MQCLQSTLSKFRAVGRSAYPEGWGKISNMMGIICPLVGIVFNKAWVATVFCVARTHLARPGFSAHAQVRTFILWWSHFAPARAPFLLKIKFRGHFYRKKTAENMEAIKNIFV